VGVCRALAAEPSILILDEPAAGLDQDETALLGVRLRQIVERGVAILLVEHDISLVARVCDHITVLDFGRVLAAGPPTETLKHEDVRTAYLGEV
jgi:branched-chain amino acid transport system ATP-binding protein